MTMLHLLYKCFQTFLKSLMLTKASFILFKKKYNKNNFKNCLIFEDFLGFFY